MNDMAQAPNAETAAKVRKVRYNHSALGDALQRFILTLVLSLVAAAATAACEKVERTLFSPRITISCKVLEKRCRFVNYGDPGEACFSVEVFHKPSGRVVTSQPVCSGQIGRDTPIWVDVVFSGEDPTSLCMGQDLRQDFKASCQVEIKEVP